MRIAGVLALALVACSSSTPTAEDAQASADVADGTSDASEVLVDAGGPDAPRVDVVDVTDAADVADADAVDVPPDLGELADMVDAGGELDAVDVAQPTDAVTVARDGGSDAAAPADAPVCPSGVLGDAMNCGRCGLACPTAPGMTAGCSADRCTLRCSTNGFADCDNDPTNGCEVDVRYDANRCGACGRSCSAAPHAAAACFEQACVLGVCATGFGNCDGNATNGCEAELATDPANCGACNTVCPSRPHTFRATCAGGMCGFTCNTGWADCDGNAANGCEVDTTANTSNCGACGRACSATGTTFVCTAGQCEITACSAGNRDCDGMVANGCETATATDRDNCGTCGNRCSSGMVCMNGACRAP